MGTNGYTPTGGKFAICRSCNKPFFARVPSQTHCHPVCKSYYDTVSLLESKRDNLLRVKFDQEIRKKVSNFNEEVGKRNKEYGETKKYSVMKQVLRQLENYFENNVVTVGQEESEFYLKQLKYLGEMTNQVCFVLDHFHGSLIVLANEFDNIAFAKLDIKELDENKVEGK